MKDLFRSIEHLIRVLLLLILGVIVFLVVRRAVIPANFGEYGHFRPGAMDDIRARRVKFAGHQTCEACHPDQAGMKSKGKHANVACEACHGPLANHAEDPSSVIPHLPDTAVLCARCHEANQAKPKWFPQVVTADHANGLACNTCHKPHAPHIGG
jgi:Cytochrome c7 and related cytochrome c